MKAGVWLPGAPVVLGALGVLCAFGALFLFRSRRARRQKLLALRRLARQGTLLDAAPVKGFHYVEGYERLLPLLCQGEPLLLRREPGNIHDCNAIRLLRQNGQAIGYFPMAYNSIPAALLDQGIPLAAWLDLGRPGQRRWLEVRLLWPGGRSLPDEQSLPGWQEGPDCPEAARPGALAVRLLAAERLQQLCPSRPRRFGGLFLDLVLLEPEEENPEGENLANRPAVPLLDSQGRPAGQLPLNRLPLHQRRMAAGMLARGQRLFACLDRQVSLPSAGLWCAALYWKEDLPAEAPGRRRENEF